MIGFEVSCFLRPAECGEGPQTRREPCIEHVRVLLPTGSRGLKLNFHFLTVEPRGDTVAKPDLSRNVPITQVVYPVVINLLESLRRYLGLATFDRLPHPLFHRALFAVGENRLFVHGNEPLLFYLRLDSAATATVGRDVVHITLVHLCNKPFGAQFFNHERPRFFYMLAGEFSGDGQ